MRESNLKLAKFGYELVEVYLGLAKDWLSFVKCLAKDWSILGLLGMESYSRDLAFLFNIQPPC